MRRTVHYAKPLCNYTGQWYEAGANKYPIKNYFFILQVHLHRFSENYASFEYLSILPIVC